MADTNKPAGKKKPKTKKDGSNQARQYTVSDSSKYLSTSANTTRRQFNRLNYLVQQAKTKKARAALARYNRNRFALNALPRCSASTQVYGGQSQGDKKWICSSLHQISFNERNFDIRECEVRVYVEGADVTPYIRGNVSWSIQTTGGMNTCTFSLNNNHDAFILTPANVCSKTDLHGWRVPLDKKNRLITGPGRSSRNVDETAKYIIYRNKYERVRPGSDTQQIDEAGFWLYPLNPFFCILNKHDCVRVFYRLPHVTGYCKLKNKKTGNCIKIKGQEYEEAWAPAFTGFIDEYDFEDDPVGGDRVVNVRCYDWRGLFNRMRVRMAIAPTATAAADKVKQKNNAIFDEVRADAASGKAVAAAGGKKTKGRTPDFMNVIIDLGIGKDLVALFNTKFSAAVQLNCPQGKAQVKCANEQFDRIRGTVANQVADLKAIYLGETLGTQKAVQPKKKDKNGKPIQQSVAKNVDYTKYKGLKPAIDQIKQDEGITVKLTRQGDGTIKAEFAGQKGAVGATEAAGKAGKFLVSTGKSLEDLASSYALEYAAASAASSVVSTATATAFQSLQIGTTVFKILNTAETIKALDAGVSSNSSLPANLKSSFTKSPDASRVLLINTYVTATVTTTFSGVTPKVKEQINDHVVTEVGRSLFYFASVPLLKRTPVIFTIKGTAAKVATALISYTASGGTSSTAVQTGADQGRLAKAYIAGTVQKFNDRYNQIKAALQKTEAEEQALQKKNPSARTRARVDEMRKKQEAAHAAGQANRIKQSESDKKTLADIILTDARFDQASAGMYGDLIRAAGAHSHPLAGMSFEMAIEWLTLTHTPISKGLESFVKKYDRGTLQQWNLNMIFGVIGRPLTYREVTAMGQGTLSDMDFKKAPYSPLHAFMHMLLPEKGTGASSIVQQDITHNPFGVKQYDYQTRLELINAICATLDYQFFVSPAGDLVFEFPHYNAMPYDFGRVFQGAYTIVKGLKHFKIASEQGDLNTAWVLQGKETDTFLDDVTKGNIKENTFKKIVIVANILARRVGVRVRHLKIEIPGVGAAFGQGGVKETLMAYGLLEIQRELGKMESATVQHEFRPYMLPNRPIHIVHRQRMALARNVNYSMAILGECSTSVDLHYIRGLHQDGSFRHMAGGYRLPVDYSGLYTGDVAQTVRFGSEPRHTDPSDIANAGTAVRKGANAALKMAESRDLANAVLQTTGRRKPKQLTNWACGPYMRDRWLTAGASYTDQMNASFKRADRYTKWTMGADGMSGEYAPVSDTGASYIAARSYRVSNSAGSPTAASTLLNTSLSNATEGGNTSDKPSKTSKDGYFGNLYDPWAFGRRDVGAGGNLFGQFGFYRVIYKGGSLGYMGKGGTADAKTKRARNGRANHRGSIGGWHNGIDFNGNWLHDAECFTPIPLTAAGLMMGFGWNGYKSASKYRWSTPRQQGTTPVSVLRFRVRSAAKYNTKRAGKIVKYTAVQQGPGIVPYESFLIDTSLEETYRLATEGFNVKPMMNANISTNTGMSLYCWGYASMPGATNSKIACELRYIHIGGLKKHPTQDYTIGKWGVDKGIRAIPADKPVCLVGSSGTNNIHLHFEMSVFRPGSKVPGLGSSVGGDDETFKEVTKANADFLRTQIKMRLGAGGVTSLSSNKLSDSWVRYFKRLNARKGSSSTVTTLDQAVEYMLARSKRYWSNVSSRSAKVTINPMFFFRPEDIIKKGKDRYKKYLESRSESLFNKASGASVCGAGSAPMKDKIALEYAICLRKSKHIQKSRQPSARRICRADKKKKLSTTKLTARSSSKARHTERVHRKLDAKVNKQTQSGGNATTRNSTTG